MGLYTDLTTSSTEIDPAAPRSGLDRASSSQLRGKAYQNDSTVRPAFTAQSEVSRIDALTGTPTAGTYALTISVPTTGLSYTTAGIAYNATAATIESAIDTAMAAHPSWTNGDLGVSEEGSAGLSDGYCDFTAANCLASMPVLISIDTSSVTGIGGAQTVTRSTPGQGNRKAAQALLDLNVVSGALHNSGEAPSWTKPACNGQSKPRSGLIKDLARQACTEDGTDYVWTAVLALYPHLRTV